MKILRPVETISTDSLLSSLGGFMTLAYSLGLMVGISSTFLLLKAKTTYAGHDVIAAISALILLLFLFFGDRYVRKTIIPEIRKRCLCDKSDKVSL